MARAHRAILVVETRREAVNFNTVAAEAAVSKDFLYSNTQLRLLIMEERPGRSGPAVPADERPSEASALVKLAVVTAALRRLRGELLAARRSSPNQASRPRRRP